METEILKRLLEKETTKIILDTNVLLDLSRFSFHTSLYILDLLQDFESMVWIPNQVFREYEKNKLKVFGEAAKRYRTFERNLSEIISDAERNIENALKNSHRYHYIDSEDFSNDLKGKLNELKNLIQSYKDNIGVEGKFSKNDWTDLLNKIDSFIENIMIGDNFTIQRLLEIISEGELRYKYKIPPGFEDLKKDGIDIFGDLIVWKQILELPKSMEVENIIFITNDEKDDWWDRSAAGSMKINSYLLDEFITANPDVEINFMTLKMFQEEISEIFCKDEIDVFVELNRDDESYVDRILDKLEDEVTSEIEMNYSTYLDYLDLGTEGVDDVEIKSCNFNEINNVYLDIVDEKIYIFYNLEFDISLNCDSYDYWGRDDDTKEIITSPPIKNYISGSINIEIERLIDREIVKNNRTYLKQDNEYENFQVIDYDLILESSDQYSDGFNIDYIEDNYPHLVENNYSSKI